MSRQERVTLEQARAAKEKAAARLERIEAVVGVGITKVAGNYAIKVNLRSGSECDKVPKTIDGVPVQVEVVGVIRPGDAG